MVFYKTKCLQNQKFKIEYQKKLHQVENHEYVVPRGTV